METRTCQEQRQCGHSSIQTHYQTDLCSVVMVLVVVLALVLTFRLKDWSTCTYPAQHSWHRVFVIKVKVIFDGIII